MSKDFRAKQIRTNKIIGRSDDAFGAQNAPGKAEYVQLALMKSGSANFSGGLTNPDLQLTPKPVGTGELFRNKDTIGNDVWMVVDGSSDYRYRRSDGGSVLFLGDVVVSGTIYAERQRINLTTADLTANNKNELILSGSVFVGENYGLSVGKTLVVDSIASGLEVGTDSYTDPRTSIPNARHGGSAVSLAAQDSVFFTGEATPDALLVIRPNEDSNKGRVGVGVADPGAKLEVLSDTTQQMWSFDQSSFSSLTVTNDSNTTLATGESGNFVLDSAGNIELNANGGTIELKDDTQLALKIDMSTTAGDAIFKDAGDAEIFRIDGSADSILMSTSKKIEFHDATAFIHAPASGKLKLDAGSTAADAIIINSAGGVDITAAGDNGSVNISATESSDFTLTSNADGEDLTISLAGATNSSLILSSTGTGTDAIDIDASEGSILVGKSLADGQTLKIGKTGAVEMTFSPHGTASSEKWSLTNTSGTAADSIKLNSVTGGIDIDAGGQFNVLAGGSLQIEGTGDSRLRTAGSGNLTVESAGIINVSAASNQQVNIGNGDNTNPVTIDSNAFTIDAAGTISIDSDNTMVASATSIGITGDGGAGSGEVSINTNDTTNGVKIATLTSGVPVTIGHGTSEVTIGDNLNVTGDATITGNLTVNGATTTISTTNLNVEDALIMLQSELDATTANPTDLGIIMERGSSGDNAAIIWDEGDDKFLLGTTAETGDDTDVTVAVGTVQVGKLEIDGTTNHIDVSTDLIVTAAADITLAAGGANVKPNADNTIALGVSGTAWSDLFLGTEAVVDFKAGDVTLTHVDTVGLLLNSGKQLQFGHADENISGDGTNLFINSAVSVIESVGSDEGHIIQRTNSYPQLSLHRLDNTIASSEFLGMVSFGGSEDNGTTRITGAQIWARAEQNWAPGVGVAGDDFATSLRFSTRPGASDFLSERMVILPNGSVGIGVSDPDAQLEVLSAGTQQKWSNDGNSFAKIDVLNASHAAISTGESGNFEIDAAGTIELDAGGGLIYFNSGGAATPNNPQGANSYLTTQMASEHFEFMGWTNTTGTRILSFLNSQYGTATVPSIRVDTDKKLTFREATNFVNSSASNTLDIEAGSSDNGTINIGTDQASNINIGKVGTTTVIEGLSLGSTIALSGDTCRLTFDGSDPDPYIERTAGGELRFTDGSNTNVTLSDLASNAVDATAFTTIAGDRQVINTARRLALIGSGSVGGTHADELYGYNGSSSPSDIMFFTSGSIKPIDSAYGVFDGMTPNDERRNAAFDCDLVSSGSVFLRGLYASDSDGDITAGSGQSSPHPVSGAGTGYVLSIDQANARNQSTAANLYGRAVLHGHLQFSYPNSDIRLQGNLEVTRPDGNSPLIAFSPNTTPADAYVALASAAQLEFGSDTRFISNPAGTTNIKIETPGNVDISGGKMVLGPDADGDDRTIVFGHSSNKTIMGIDDSQDLFAIHTGGAFLGSNNDFEINADGDVSIHNNLLIGEGNATSDDALNITNGRIKLGNCSGAHIKSNASQEIRVETDSNFVVRLDDDADTAASGFFRVTSKNSGSDVVRAQIDHAGNLQFDGTLQIGSSTTVDSILDQDNLGGGTSSDTALATQQSIKAYVDAAVAGAAPSGAQTAITSLKNNSLVVGRSDSDDLIDFATNNEIKFELNGNEKFKVDQSHVTSTSLSANSSMYTFASRNTHAGSNAGILMPFWLSDTDANEKNAAFIRVGKVQEWTTTASTQDGYISFEALQNGAVSPTQTMRILAGKVGINKTNPATALDVDGTVTATAFAGNADTATKIASITNDDIVQKIAVQTLTNKTLTEPTIQRIAYDVDSIHDVPNVASDTFAVLAAAQTLTNKTIGAATIAGHMIPDTNNSYDLGSNSNRFANIYTNDLNLCNEGRGNDVDGTSGNWTIQEGEDSLFVINNITGKKFKMMLQPVEDGE